MANKIYCRTVAKGRQAFYLEANSKEYFLFEQDFRSSNKKMYRNSISICEVRKLKSHASTAVRHTAEKLIPYIKYVEKEYGIAVLKKTKNKDAGKAKFYTRKGFNWNEYTWEVA